MVFLLALSWLAALCGKSCVFALLSRAIVSAVCPFSVVSVISGIPKANETVNTMIQIAFITCSLINIPGNTQTVFNAIRAFPERTGPFFLMILDGIMDLIDT